MAKKKAAQPKGSPVSPAPDSPEAASQHLGRLITGYWLSQAVYVAARLKIADLLAEGPRAADDLAQAAGVHSGALYRMLRALASVGVFRENGDRTFELTPAADLLREDAPHSQRALALMMGEEQYRAYAELIHSVGTGEPAFARVFGQEIFPYLSRHPRQAAEFDAAMTSVHGRETPAMIAAYDFSEIKTLVDVGGGNGSLLRAVLAANPHLQGILYDLPNVVARAEDALAEAGLADRCRTIGGDFFASVPAGGDAYLLRHIIHDWDDARAAGILRHCRDVLPPGGRVLVVENVIQPGNDPSFAKLLDLTMLVVPGGKERTEAEFRTLFASAGLKLARIVPTSADVNVLEAHAE